MFLDNIIEKRKVDNGNHSLVLEISEDDFNTSYGDYNSEIASEIVGAHLLNRGDDGRPRDVKIQKDVDNMIRISANLDYLGNDYTDIPLS